MAEITIKTLRRRAIAATLFARTELKRAIETLGFVQCDPIRAPARAQDLILAQRVEGYRAGDLERRYPELGVEEDYLYAYGIVPEETWRLLHPRRPTKKLNQMEERVRALVCARERVHPRELEAHLGSKRQVNAWGSYSKATTRALERLHYRGVLRVAGREKGIRLYQAAREQEEPLEPKERLRRLVLLMARILTPVPAVSFGKALSLLAHSAPALKVSRKALSDCIASGELRVEVVEGVKYLWPREESGVIDVAETVRFLAPFDPVVWDRYRFEHLWGWGYRFEAYTPPAKRKMGYYALPMLWGEEVIGWVNVSKSGGRVACEPGFVKSKPAGRAFRSAYSDEVERMKVFLSREEAD